MSLPVLRALLFAGECFAASLLLPVLVFTATALMRRAALRHLAWTTLFGVLAVLPVAALLLPPRRIVEHVTAPVVAVAAAPVAAPVTPSLFTMENLVLGFAAIWLGGLIWQMLRLCTGGLGLMRLRRASVPFAAPIACAVRLAADETGPSTFGILRPVILLPRSATGWTPGRLDAVLRHEAAHVARRDALSQFIARLVCAVYWINPLLWQVARSLRREAEIAADDAVLASGMTPSAYAAELVGLAAQSRGRASSIPLGIAMAQPPLTQRVEAVLAENVSRKGVSRMDIARTVCFGLTATLLLGAARFDLAVAQDAPVVAAPADKAMAVKAKADAVAARARATADAETDPVKRAPYRKDADQVAADAGNVKANADRVSAEARRQNAEAMQQAGAAMRAGADARRQNAEAMQQAGAAMRGAAEARRQAMRAMADAHIEEQVAKALADAHIQEAVVKAMADAHVDAVTAKAVADAHIEEKIAAAMASVRPIIQAAIAQAAAAAPMAPVPPAPPPPSPAPVSPPPYAPN